jgi:molecular chaperone GrpE
MYENCEDKNRKEAENQQDSECVNAANACNSENSKNTDEIIDDEIVSDTDMPTTEQDDTAKIIEKPDDEVAILRDTLLRKAADYDNLRKRLEKEKEDAIKYSNGRFAKDLLIVIDNFERINDNIKSIDSDLKMNPKLMAIFDGITLCGKELISVFKKHGLSVIDVKEGDQFNPLFHQAVCEVESAEQKPGLIVRVFQLGYMHYDRLLRPSMVSVSKTSQ